MVYHEIGIDPRELSLVKKYLIEKQKRKYLTSKMKKTVDQQGD